MDFLSLSNMPKNTTGKEMVGQDKYVWDIYQETPIMSTYTLAMVVAIQDDNVTELHDGKRRLRAWSATDVFKEDNVTKRNQVLNDSVIFLSFFEKYLAIDEQLSKTDLLETSHMASAMENWGLIIYRIDNFFQAPITAHEIAHYWFGNLVTCKDWSE